MNVKLLLAPSVTRLQHSLFFLYADLTLEKTGKIREFSCRERKHQILKKQKIYSVVSSAVDTRVIILVLHDDPCGVILYSLQLVDGVRWSAVEHSIAVVDPG